MSSTPARSLAGEERERGDEGGRQTDVRNRNRRERKTHVEVEKGKKTDRTGKDWRRIEKALSFTCQSVLVGMSQSSLEA